MKLLNGYYLVLSHIKNFLFFLGEQKTEFRREKLLFKDVEILYSFRFILLLQYIYHMFQIWFPAALIYNTRKS